MTPDAPGPRASQVPSSWQLKLIRMEMFFIRRLFLALQCRASVLDAVQKYYKYKPYLLNGKAVDVETTVSVFVGLQCNSPTPYWIH